MLPEYKHKTNLGVGAGILIQLLGQFLSTSGRPLETILGMVLIFVGFGFFIWGCAQYARAKGQSPWLGALGILSIVGLLVLVFLPDKHKGARARPSAATDA
jgi:hypothetical protein